MKEIAAAVVLLLCLVFGIWLWTAGPCWVYSFEKAGEVPARCVSEFVNK